MFSILQNSLYGKRTLAYVWIMLFKLSTQKLVANSHHVLIAIVHERGITQSRNPFKSFRGAFPNMHAQCTAAGQIDKCNPLDLQINFCIVRDKWKWDFCTIDPRQAGH